MSRFSSTPQPWKALAIGALLVCCVLGSHVAAAADSNTSVPSAVEPETAKFLQALVAGIPELREHITGDNYCTDWDFLACEDDVVKGVLLDSWSLKRPASLPELPEDLDGSKVTVERFLMNSHRSNLIGTLPSTWGKLTKMQNFQLIGNNLEGTLPAEWSEMTGLAQIRMSRNNLTGTLPEQWSRLKVLTVIVSRNHLTGTLPASWSALSPLSVVFVDRNQLTGTLPAEWSALSSLDFVFADHNQLTGTLPAEWSALSSLGQLALNDNQLSGSLPAGWSSLRGLSFLALENNHFCGCVPPEWDALEAVRPTFDNNVSGDACATTNACPSASSSSSSESSSSSSESSSSSSESSSSSSESSSSSSESSSSSSESSSSSSESSSSYMLTDDSQCASYCDAAHWQSLGNPNGWPMLALLCTSVLWSLV